MSAGNSNSRNIPLSPDSQARAQSAMENIDTETYSSDFEDLWESGAPPTEGGRDEGAPEVTCLGDAPFSRAGVGGRRESRDDVANPLGFVQAGSCAPAPLEMRGALDGAFRGFQGNGCTININMNFAPIPQLSALQPEVIEQPGLERKRGQEGLDSFFFRRQSRKSFATRRSAKRRGAREKKRARGAFDLVSRNERMPRAKKFGVTKCEACGAELTNSPQYIDAHQRSKKCRAALAVAAGDGPPARTDKRKSNRGSTLRVPWTLTFKLRVAERIEFLEQLVPTAPGATKCRGFAMTPRQIASISFGVPPGTLGGATWRIDNIRKAIELARTAPGRSGRAIDRTKAYKARYGLYDVDMSVMRQFREMREHGR